MDNEIKGEGNSLNFKFRMHDPRVGRFFAVDPLFREYPYYSPYSFAGNKVIRYKELEGLEEEDAIADWLRGQGRSILDFQDKRSGVVKAAGHMIDGTLLFTSGLAYTVGSEGLGAGLGGGFLMTLGTAEWGLGIANLTNNKRASRANNFLELVGMNLEEKHGLTNASAYLYYGQEFIEVGTSINNAYKFIKSGKAVRMPKSLSDLAKNAKSYYGVFTTAIVTPARTGKLVFEGLYDMYVANTPTEALRNLDLESWKSSITFVDANINKVENKLGVKIGFEVLDNNGDLFVSEGFYFEVKDESALRDLFKKFKDEAPKVKEKKEAHEKWVEGERKSKKYICFVKGTKVWFQGNKLVNIENIKKGDKVYTYDFLNKKNVLRKVLKTKTSLVKGLVKVSIGNTDIVSTSEHPFYVEGKWVPANKLKVGDKLKTIQGTLLKVTNVKENKDEVKVYNFQVEENANYYVSSTGILVHNESYIIDLNLKEE